MTRKASLCKYMEEVLQLLLGKILWYFQNVICLLIRDVLFFLGYCHLDFFHHNLKIRIVLN